MSETPTATLATDDPILIDFAELVGDTGPVAVAGAQTRWTVGGALEPDARIVSAPAGIVDYQPEEMTVTVRAGTSVAELHAVLAERGQRTALPEREGSVGGALVVGENGIHALGRGLVRTALLQVRYISAEGRVVSSGGPTVKNVSGFDLPRLVVGSLGTLGLVAEVILRTNPIPPVSRWLMAEGVDPQIAYDTVQAPSSVLSNGTTTWVQLEGHGPDVDVEQGALAAVGSFVETNGPPPLPPERWSLSPAEALKLCGSAGSESTGAFVATIGLGLVFAERPQPAREPDAAITAIAEQLKQNFDPTGRLNPGRMPGRRSTEEN